MPHKQTTSKQVVTRSQTNAKEKETCVCDNQSSMEPKQKEELEKLLDTFIKKCKVISIRHHSSTTQNWKKLNPN